MDSAPKRAALPFADVQAANRRAGHVPLVALFRLVRDEPALGQDVARDFVQRLTLSRRTGAR